MTLVATVLHTAPRYASPDHRTAGTVPASWYGRPSLLPVIGTQPGWVEVRLAQRPNESTAWLPDGDVALGRSPDRIVIDTGTSRLALYDEGALVFSAPAGIGAPGDPVPRGNYFVAFDEPTLPGPGPFIIVTSAHAAAVKDGAGSGDAVIGIRGPLGDDRAPGAGGARLSPGCIRLPARAFAQLAQVPPGTPVVIVS
jgi:lipoprotein-anchoring transpeptidase ErfK/SrfK